MQNYLCGVSLRIIHDGVLQINSADASHTSAGTSGTRSSRQGDNGNRIFIYQDGFRKAEYNSLFTERQEKAYGEVPLTDKDIFSINRRGLFAFVSNLDENAKEVYLDYKERWEIENCFDYMKNSVAKKPLHAHDNGSIDAQCFINRVALMYFYRLLRAMDMSGLKTEGGVLSRRDHQEGQQHL